jgi:hypothetical protein
MAKIQPFYRCVLVWRWWSLITIVRLDDGTVVRHIGGKDGNDNVFMLLKILIMK